jgi:hypothetical protein
MNAENDKFGKVACFELFGENRMEIFTTADFSFELRIIKIFKIIM